MSAIRTIGRACRRVVRVVAVIGIMSIGTAPAHADPVATETILGITRIGRPADGLAIVNARVDLPAGARWTTDPDAGPLWLTVADGSLEIELGGGLGRIERKPDLFLGGRITPLEPLEINFEQARSVVRRQWTGGSKKQRDKVSGELNVGDVAGVQQHQR